MQTGKYAAYTHNEGVIKWCINVGNTKNMFTISNSWAKGDIFLLWLPNLSPRLQNTNNLLERKTFCID